MRIPEEGFCTQKYRLKVIVRLDMDYVRRRSTTGIGSPDILAAQCMSDCILGDTGYEKFLYSNLEIKEFEIYDGDVLLVKMVKDPEKAKVAEQEKAEVIAYMRNKTHLHIESKIMMSSTIKFLADVLEEVERARTKFPDNAHLDSAMHEEAGEVTAALLEMEYEPKKGVTCLDVWKEAVQTACVACRVGTEGDSTFKNFFPPYSHLDKEDPTYIGQSRLDLEYAEKDYQQTIKELSLLVNLLCSKLEPDDTVRLKALEYVNVNNLVSPLR